MHSEEAPILELRDFRYTYLSGEVGLLPRLSTRFLVTYLYGLEGPEEELEKNAGLSVFDVDQYNLQSHQQHSSQNEEKVSS